MKHTKLPPSADEVRDLLTYSPDSGVFSWARPRGSARAGKPAGTDVDGYVSIVIRGSSYKAHRLAWLLHYGRWPTCDIDHINGVRSDNKISNLREATRRVNNQNRRAPNQNNKCGFLGVSRQGRRYSANIGTNGVMRRIAWFDTPEEAHEAYLAAKRALHPGSTL